MAHADRQYPSAEDLDIPLSGDPSPDATYFLGWKVQHSRLWLSNILISSLLLVSIFANILQSTRELPLVYVTLEHGYPVVTNPMGETEIDGVIYRPVHMRQVVQGFIEARYEYNWQDLQKINRAISYLSSSAVDTERQKIQQADLPNRIYQRRAVWRLSLEMNNWTVEPLGEGRFRVRVPGVARINDTFEHTDTQNPFPKSFVVELVLGTVPITDLNPFGYQIVETGTDIIF